MQKTNTIYVNARFVTQPLTGVQRYAFECCMQMKKTNSNLVFLSPKNTVHREWADKLDVQTLGFNTGHRWEQLDLAFYLVTKKDAVLFNPCNTAPWLLNINYITVHDISYALYKENNTFLFSSWYNFLLPRIIKKARHVFTVSETVKRELIAIYDTAPEKISITYNGIPAPFETNGSIPIQKEKIILAVGSLTKRKNLTLLVDAFLSSSLKNHYTLVIAGSSYQAFSKINLQAHDRIVIKSSLTDTELSACYQQAEIFVSLSLYEGFGLPVLEAICSNCKVLCADIATYHELFEDYVYFCDHLDKADVARMLESMSQTELSEPVDQELLKNKFSFSESAAHLLSWLENTPVL